MRAKHRAVVGLERDNDWTFYERLEARMVADEEPAEPHDGMWIIVRCTVGRPSTALLLESRPTRL